ncbi:MAG: hypothetical protein JW395_1627 [Nitrospira sp.]|nr:hypothetical protein [Nitrospira sp.]
MKLQNEFLVDAPLADTWAMLLDVRRVAECLPGATLESDGTDGIYRGSMQMRLGPMTLAYKGTVRMAEIEEDSHSVTMGIKAKELKGQGTASARIRNQLELGENGATRVSVETDLNITGRPAQFGRGIMEDVASKMLDDFAKRIEQEVVGNNGHAGAPETTTGGALPPGSSPPPTAEDTAQLDLGSVIAGPIVKRVGVGVGAAVAVVIALSILRRRRTGMRLRIDWR